MTEKSPPLLLSTTLMFTITTVVTVIGIPWYGWAHGFAGNDLAFMLFFIAANGLGITAGYHRLWAHRSYEASKPVQLGLLIFSTMAVQNSVITWASGHRTHHRHVDDRDLDPYAATRGFWFSHIGWMLRNYPSGTPHLDNARDLLNDPWLQFQHRFYLPLALLTNLGFPLAAGCITGHIVASLLLSGFLRLVICHHVTFFINSLAHRWGHQPYTEQNTARDNAILAWLTWGEGYHNFHHLFQYDYRNGIKWWQWDPTKWLILALSWVGLTRNLKRASEFAIQRAQLTLLFSRTERGLAQAGMSAALEPLKLRMAAEYETFMAALNEWTSIQEERYRITKHELQQHWEHTQIHQRLGELETRLREQYKRLLLLSARIA